MPDPDNNPDNLVNCKYFDISQMKTLKACNDKTHASFKEFWWFSVPYPINKYCFSNYSYEFCPTGSSAGGTQLYVRKHFLYNFRPKHLQTQWAWTNF